MARRKKHDYNSNNKMPFIEGTRAFLREPDNIEEEPLQTEREQAERQEGKRQCRLKAKRKQELHGSADVEILMPCSQAWRAAGAMSLM